VIMKKYFIICLGLIISVILTGQVYSDTFSGRAYFDLGVFAYEDGDYDAALSNFKTALKLSPKNALYIQYLGKTYLKQKKYKLAQTSLLQAESLQPDLSELQYDIGLLYYYLNQYSKAVDRFEKVYAHHPNNVLSAYFAGVCFFQMKQYQKAIPYFLVSAQKCVTIKDKSHYYAGMCYQYSGDSLNAIKMFEYVKGQAGHLASQAQRWLSAIESQVRHQKKWSISWIGGLRYDDNVILASPDEDQDTDAFHSSNLLSMKYEWLQHKHYSTGFQLTYFQTVFDKRSDYDSSINIMDVYFHLMTDEISLKIAYRPWYCWFNDESYQARHQFKLNTSWKIDNNFYGTIDYTFSRNNYFLDQTRDGHTHDLTTDLTYQVTPYHISITGGMDISDNSASRDDAQYEQIGVHFNGIWQVNAIFAIHSTLSYQTRNYERVMISSTDNRKDTRYFAEIGMSQNIYKDWISIYADLTYTKRDANFHLYDYRKHTAEAGIKMTY